MRFQVVPLSLELELNELVALDLFAKLVARTFYGPWLAYRQLALPKRPHNAVVSCLQRHEQRELVKPSGLGTAKCVKRIALRRSTSLKGFKCPAQQRDLPCNDRAKINVVGRKFWPFV